MDTLWIILIGVYCFTLGLLIGICIGYYKLACWYKKRTGKDFWLEIREGRKD